MVHDIRTIYLVVYAVRRIQDTNPLQTLLCKRPHSADLMLPESWDVTETIQGFEGALDIHITTHVELFRDNFELFPGDPYPYIRLRASANASVTPRPSDLPAKSDMSECWLDDKSTNAGIKVRLGPLDAARDLFLDFYIRMSP